MIMNQVCLISEIDCIRRFILTVDICNCTVCVKMVGKNDKLQLLLGRHCIFDIIKFS